MSSNTQSSEANRPNNLEEYLNRKSKIQTRKFIYSARYIIKYMPKPCFASRSVLCRSHDWPAQPGLTKGSTLSSQDRVMLTTSIISKIGVNAPDDKIITITGFLKAVNPYLPEGVHIPTDWPRLVASKESVPECIPVIVDFEEFVYSYIETIEAQLLAYYIESGDRFGKAYMEILSRKFKKTGWNATAPTVSKLEASCKVDSKHAEPSENGEQQSIQFNFTEVKAEWPDAIK